MKSTVSLSFMQKLFILYSCMEEALCEWISIIMIVGYNIYGTGSYPEPPHGWHRKILLIVRYKPFTGPCFFRASMAYCEHVGVNLHDGGVNGDMQFL